MARVPTWAELRLDATKLAQLQNECYRSVHHMLDHSIPELDRKLLQLRHDGDNRMHDLEARFQALSTDNFVKLCQEVSPPPPPRAAPAPAPARQVTVPKRISPEPQKLLPGRRPHAVRQLFSNNSKPALKPAIKKSASQPDNGFQHYLRQPSPPQPVYEEIDPDPDPDPEHEDDEFFGFQGSEDLGTMRRSSTPEPAVANTKTRNRFVRGEHDIQPGRRPQANGYHTRREPAPEPFYEPMKPIDLSKFVHLNPPPLPLSHYLKMNRPYVVEAANARAAYLKKSAERRKLSASAKTINALDQIRAASRTSSNKGSSLRSSLRGMTRSSTGPNLSQIKCKLSEQEMKRLTAKTYNRLPEVKRQRVQEVTKHLKVQNYKNKLEYGRRLLENRRRGIINYPLKGHHDDSSVMSSLEESLTDSFERSADGLKFDQYYS